MTHPEHCVLKGVTYSEIERDYVLDVMRKFNLSFPVSETEEFIPALCEVDTPKELHPSGFQHRVSYEMKYTYLPDSVVHQLMIRSYRHLNPDKIWRKGLRIDMDWLKLAAVVDMDGDDATLKIDVYSNGTVEPWKLLQNIRQDILAINQGLGLQAKDYIVVREDSEKFPVEVNALLAFKMGGKKFHSIYNDATGNYSDYSVEELLGNTFGEEVMANAEKRINEDRTSHTGQPLGLTITIINEIQQESTSEDKLLEIIQQLIEKQSEVNEQVVDRLLDHMAASSNAEAITKAIEAKKDPKKKKGFMEKLSTAIQTTAAGMSIGQAISKSRIDWGILLQLLFP